MKNSQLLTFVVFVAGMSAGEPLKAENVTFSCPATIETKTFFVGSPNKLKSFYWATPSGNFLVQIVQPIDISGKDVNFSNISKRSSIKWSKDQNDSDLVSVTLQRQYVDPGLKSPQCEYKLVFEGFHFQLPGKKNTSSIDFTIFNNNFFNCLIKEDGKFDCVHHL